jgi:N6-L-threonylcarbamoyladenine synthase
MIILGIETSCDETGLALVKDGEEILGSSLVSQIITHQKYGGVVPELAARKHSESIDYVLSDLLNKTKVPLNEIDAIAVTYGPGLPGALLVGVAFAKALALMLSKPIIPVNHIEAHLESINTEFKNNFTYPALGLIVSGGHTILLEIENPGVYHVIGKTRDDAAGEAFDKVAKLMNLEYPGGPVIDYLAKSGNDRRFYFKTPKFSDGSNDFSFSGIKTAVLKIIKDNPLDIQNEQFKKDLAASFQYTVVKILVNALRKAWNPDKYKSIFVTGGVAVNSELRGEIVKLADKYNSKSYIPSPPLCTDNGIMIAILGSRLYIERRFADMSLDAKPNLKLT